VILNQGIQVWNEWREENPDIVIDLSGTDLSERDLQGFNLNKADMSGTDFYGAYLVEADMSEANLNKAAFDEADLVETNLSKANLEKSYLFATNLSDANLRGANLQGANLRGANLTEAWVGGTVFGSNDLSETIGLEEVEFEFPFSVSTSTIQLSKGKIPEVFLRGCGLSDWEIESAKLYNPDLSHDEINKILYKIYDLRASQALQISPLFISYSHADASFVDELEEHLNEKGIRFWRDVHHAISGRLEKQIGRAIQLNPTVLLILSEHSLKSDWVEYEVRAARELEKEMGRDVLCPVALDDSWKNSPWPKRIMEQIIEYNILDFSNWKNDSKFGRTFNKLIDGLELFYKG
jgi:uncharacterized protein YjbI with pentapeptide repeats